MAAGGENRWPYLGRNRWPLTSLWGPAGEIPAGYPAGFHGHRHHSAHATELTERALPGSGSGARFAGRVPLGWSPSLHRLRRPALGVVRQLHR